MNATLSNVFLANLAKAILKTYEPIRMKQPNAVFLHMFNWFIDKYSKTTIEGCKENWQRMAANWHPSNGFEPLATCLFIGASYASAARYPMNNCNVINISLHVIKRCRMYSKECKNWIAHETSPRQSEKRSTRSTNIGQTRSHLSTRQLPQPCNMDTAWPSWTMIR